MSAASQAGGGPMYTLGPQSPSDGVFKARMRLHQSWYRANVLRLPFGTGPQLGDRTFFGNMLDAAGAEAGANFLSPEIFLVAQRRIAEGGGVEAFRCLRNMLSSQPMAFNLFAPLTQNLALASACFQTLLPELERVTAVRFEYAPTPRKEFLNDRTSFDVWVDYRQRDGRRAFLGIETKLTEPFSPLQQDLATAARYEEVKNRCRAIWSEPELSKLMDPRWAQLWRNHLLVHSMLLHPQSQHEVGHVMVVHHAGDAECTRVIAGYRGLLVQPDTSFIDAPLDAIVERWGSCTRTESERAWLSAFALRYLALDRSA